MDTRLQLLRSIDLSGPFTVAQAHSEGLSDYDLRRLLAQGRIVRRRRGVYVGATYAKAADAEPATSHALDVQALLLTLSYRLTAVGTSAARIHGMEFYKPPPRRIFVVTDDPRVVPLRRDGYDLRRADLAPGDVTEVHGVPVTSAVQTYLDVVDAADFLQGIAIGDSALRKGLLTKPEVLARLETPTGVFLPEVRDMISFCDSRAESVLESVARALFHLHGIPAPQIQVWLLDGIRVDFFWPAFRTVAEADGLAKYLLGGPPKFRETVDDERARQIAIEAAGYAIYRFGWDDLEEPARLVAGLRAKFNARSNLEH